ncbi:MAG TPA: M23 family metallopeptidase [Actinomycetota bacterium]|nr:M23 family metallopeptidase [Actinomycetota bacterium]
MRRILSALVVLSLLVPGPARADPGGWTWPVAGPVIRGFDPPDSPFGSGHRGIDIAAAVGTPVLAAESGVVAFAGPVGGRLFLTIDHGAGLESTYSWLDALAVRRGDDVQAGDVVAWSGTGHVGVEPAHLHFGVRLDDVYVDPMAYLGPIDVWRFIRLAPLAEPAAVLLSHARVADVPRPASMAEHADP